MAARLMLHAGMLQPSMCRYQVQLIVLSETRAKPEWVLCPICRGQDAIDAQAFDKTQEGWPSVDQPLFKEASKFTAKAMSAGRGLLNRFV